MLGSRSCIGPLVLVYFQHEPAEIQLVAVQAEERDGVHVSEAPGQAGLLQHQPSHRHGQIPGADVHRHRQELTLKMSKLLKVQLKSSHPFLPKKLIFYVLAFLASEKLLAVWREMEQTAASCSQVQTVFGSDFFESTSVRLGNKKSSSPSAALGQGERAGGRDDAAAAGHRGRAEAAVERRGDPGHAVRLNQTSTQLKVPHSATFASAEVSPEDSCLRSSVFQHFFTTFFTFYIYYTHKHLHKDGTPPTKSIVKCHLSAYY